VLKTISKENTMNNIREYTSFRTKAGAKNANYRKPINTSPPE